MKKLLIASVLLLLSACAPQQHQSTAWSMSWSCNGNAACVRNFNAYSGSGSFSSESDCLAWETGFLNAFGGPPYPTCSACTGN